MTIMKDEETGRSRGFGFVNLESETEGAKAVEALNGYTVRVTEACWPIPHKARMLFLSLAVCLATPDTHIPHD